MSICIYFWHLRLFLNTLKIEKIYSQNAKVMLVFKKVKSGVGLKRPTVR